MDSEYIDTESPHRVTSLMESMPLHIDYPETPDSRDFDALLVQLVAQYPALFDKSIPEYKNAVIRENCRTQIAEIMHAPAANCCKRWGQLRESFGREKRKREEETKSGSGLSQRRGFPLYENMLFLKAHMKKRRAFTNVSLSQPSVLNIQRLPGSSNNWNPLTLQSLLMIKQNERASGVHTLRESVHMMPSVTSHQAASTSTVTTETLALAASSYAGTETSNEMSPPNLLESPSSTLDVAQTETEHMLPASISTSRALDQSISPAIEQTIISSPSIMQSPACTSRLRILSEASTTTASHKAPNLLLRHSMPFGNTQDLIRPFNTTTPPPSTSTPPPFSRATTPSYSIPNSPASSYTDTSSSCSLFNTGDSYGNTPEKMLRNLPNARSRLYLDMPSTPKRSYSETTPSPPSNVTDAKSCYHTDMKRSKKVDPIESAVLSLSGTLINDFTNNKNTDKRTKETENKENNNNNKTVDEAFGMLIAAELANISEPLR